LPQLLPRRLSLGLRQMRWSRWSHRRNLCSPISSLIGRRFLSAFQRLPIQQMRPPVAAAEPHIADELPEAEGPLPPAAVAALAASEAEREGAEPAAAGARDKLILIEGIGPVYESKLNAAGIYTFRQMMAAGPDRLREIIQPQAGSV